METPKPGDFPVGSVESRAAMRAMIESEESAESRMEFHLGLAGHGPGDCRGKWCLSGRCALTYGSRFRVSDGIVEQVIPMNMGGRKRGHT